MGRIWKAMPWFFIIGVFFSLFTAFVLQNLWNWFAVPALHLPEISFWTMYGFTLIIGLFQGYENSERQAQEHTNNLRWALANYVLDFSLSDDQRKKTDEFAKEKKNEEEAEFWLKIISSAFGKVVGNSFTLVVGWGVHSFLT